MYAIAETLTQCEADRERFYQRHSDAAGWKHWDWEPTEQYLRHLTQLWSKLTNIQNGRDLDDCSLPPTNNKITKLVLPNLRDKMAKILVLGAGTGREVALLRNKGYNNSI